MKTISLLPIAAFALLAAAGAHAETSSSDGEKAKVQAVLENLDKALVTEDIDLYARQVAQDKITGFGAASTQAANWEQIKTALQKAWADMDTPFIRPKTREIQIYGDVAIFAETFDFEFVYKGKTVCLQNVRTTGALEKQNGQWLLIQVHSSFPAPSRKSQS